MRVMATVAALVGFAVLGGTAHAEGDPSGDGFQLGFAKLDATTPGVMGTPISPEHPAEDGSPDTWQWTTLGLAYVHAGIVSFTDGWHHEALVPGRGLVTWDGLDVAPPPPPPPTPAPARVATPSLSPGIVAYVTHYMLSGQMRNGQTVYHGAAACGSAIGWLSTIQFDDGERFFCADTGYLAANQVDVWGDPGADARLSGHVVHVVR
jgi:hypothetical protein